MSIITSKSSTTNDLSSTEDLFNIENYTQGLAEFIATCCCPMTIAIQGNWGSGKTSMMLRLQNEKSIIKNCECVNINTWQYSQFELGNQLPIVFYSCLIEKIAKPKDKETAPKILKLVQDSIINVAKLCASSISGVVPGPAIIAQAVQAATTKLVENAEKIQNEGEKKEDSLVKIVESIQSNFKNVVEARLEESKKDRIVIFIDDLDRIEPQRAVEVMELLKVLLECDKCVFVLAIDYDVVVRGVKSKYGSDIDDRKARNFFDKIIQVPFSLPIGKYNINNYMSTLIKDEDMAKSLMKDGKVKEDIMNLVKTSVGCNPRAIKRLLNSYLLLHKINDLSKGSSAGDEANVNDVSTVLFASLCLQLAYEKVYEALLASCDSYEEINKFFKAFSSTEENKDFDEKVGRDRYSEIEWNQLNEFIDHLLEVINEGKEDEITEDRLIYEEGYQILKNALKSSTSTVVSTGSAVAREEGELPAKIQYVYEVVRLVRKSGKEVTSNTVSKAETEIADNHHISKSTVADKCTRQLGINAEAFVELVRKYLNGTDEELVAKIIENNRSKALNELIKEQFAKIKG